MSETAAARPGWLQIAAAILVPVALVTAWVNLVLSFEDREAEDVLMGGAVEAIESDPQVVVVGNSLAYRAIDPTGLQRELGIEGDVHLLTYPGSWAPTWYAALKNQVYAHGLEPDVVVILNTLEFMLRTDRPHGERESDLRAVMTEDEPVIQQKVYGARSMSGPLAAIDDKRGRVGKTWIDLLLAAPFALRNDAPKEAADKALSEVFEAPGAMDPKLTGRVIPIVEVDKQRRRDDRNPTDTLLPDLIDVARDHGSKVVVARVPVSRVGRKMHPLPSRETERATVALLNDRQVGYIDLHALSLPSTAYVDDQHMSVAGKAIFTKLLAEKLLEIGAFDEEPFPEARVPPRPPDVRREGNAEVDVGKVPNDKLEIDGCHISVPSFRFAHLSDPFLDEIGLGRVSPILLLEDGDPLKPHTPDDPESPCAGTSFHDRRTIDGWSAEQWPREHTYSLALAEDLPMLGPEVEDPAAWWVYPGTTLVLEHAEDAGLPEGPAHVTINAVALGRGVLPDVWADDTPVVLTKSGLRVTGTAELDAAPRELRIEVPPAGHWIVVRHLGIDVGDWTGHLLGGPDERDNSVRLLGGAHEPELTAVPPFLTLELPEPIPGEDLANPPHFPLPDLRMLSLPGLSARTGVRNDLPENHPYRTTMMKPLRHCSPLRLYEDGVELNKLRNPRMMKRPRTSGSYLHMRHGVDFRPISGAYAEHTYELRLAEDRVCHKHVWLYPGDEVEIRNPEMLKRLYGGADTLRLGGFAFGQRDTPQVTVTVESKAGIHLQTTVRSGLFESEQLPIRLITRLPPSPDDVVVRLSTDDDGPWLLMQVVAFEDLGRPSIRARPRPKD